MFESCNIWTRKFPSDCCLGWICCIMFLVSLICLNHIFAPNQKKTSKASKEKTPSWVVDLLLLSSFLRALTCSSLFAIILRMRRLKNENIPQVSQKPGKAMDTETGSSLEEHEIHFGGRPDFHDIFAKFPNETGGSDVGVLVCGPGSMKESVASVCQQKSVGFQMGAKKKKPCFSFHSLSFSL